MQLASRSGWRLRGSRTIDQRLGPDSRIVTVIQQPKLLPRLSYLGHRRRARGTYAGADRPRRAAALSSDIRHADRRAARRNVIGFSLLIPAALGRSSIMEKAALYVTVDRARLPRRRGVARPIRLSSDPDVDRGRRSSRWRRQYGCGCSK
jgi:hypothetical protein